MTSELTKRAEELARPRRHESKMIPDTLLVEAIDLIRDMATELERQRAVIDGIDVEHWKARARDAGTIGYLRGAVCALQYHDIPVEAKDRIDAILKHVEEREKRL